MKNKKQKVRKGHVSIQEFLKFALGALLLIILVVGVYFLLRNLTV